MSKALAGRPQDEIDVQGIVDRQGPSLNRDQTLADLSEFCQLLELDGPMHLVERLFE